jgi:hypothetical protein
MCRTQQIPASSTNGKFNYNRLQEQPNSPLILLTFSRTQTPRQGEGHCPTVDVLDTYCTNSPSVARLLVTPRGSGAGNSPICLYGANEELGAVGVGACIRHGQDTCKKQAEVSLVPQEASHLGSNSQVQKLKQHQGHLSLQILGHPTVPVACLPWLPARSPWGDLGGEGVGKALQCEAKQEHWLQPLDFATLHLGSYRQHRAEVLLKVLPYRVP